MIAQPNGAQEKGREMPWERTVGVLYWPQERQLEYLFVRS